MKKKSMVSINRVPSKVGTVTATISIEFDPNDQESAERFARAMRELIPEEDRATFMADFERAGKSAGFKAS